MHAACMSIGKNDLRSRDEADDLFDLPLSAPYPCINITSDAFAFAMVVRDMAASRFGVPPGQIYITADRDALFKEGANRWQKFSLHTLSEFASKTEGRRCPVTISADGRTWQAAHNDPVFAEAKKELHVHDMPEVYARELAKQWEAVLRRKISHFHARSGQRGGRRFLAPTAGTLPAELREQRRG